MRGEWKMTVNWEKILILPTQSIREALKVIDEQSSRIALVTDENKKLLGTVTDGDIRRALLKSTSIDEEVRHIMNPHPLTIAEGENDEKVKTEMHRRGILSVPVVHQGRVVGLKSVIEQNTTDSFENPIFLMAGGFGTRLRPLTNDCPKPLLKVGDKPILEITLRNFISYGFKNFYISTHYMPEKIQEYFGNGDKWGVNIKYVYEEEPLGTGGALSLLPKDLMQLPLIMINGDILTNINYNKLLSFHNSNSADATMCVREYEYQIPYGVISAEGNRVVKMVEKPVQQFYVNAGIYVLNPDIISLVNDNQKIDMPTLLEQKMEQGGTVNMFPIHEYWLDIGRMDDFEKAQRDIYNIGFNL